MIETVFSGSGWAFPPKFKTPSNGPDMLTGQALIEQAINIMLNTLVGERLLLPNYGSNLSEFMFQKVDAEVMADLREQIATAIAEHEPRITLKTIRFDTRDIYDGTLNIELEYVINESNSLANMVFPFYLSDG